MRDSSRLDSTGTRSLADQRPDGVKIAAGFVGAIVAVSLVSRLWRVTELRASGVELDPVAQRYVAEAGPGPLRVVAHDPDRRDRSDYERMERRARALSRIGVDEVVLFLEVTVRDPSEFAPAVTVAGEDRFGRRLLRAAGASVPNAIAAVLLHLRDRTGDLPHAYFSWSEKDPLREVVDFVLFGGGDIAPVTHEILREAEPDPERRPVIHVA